jgi:5-methylcytosine-specific restriction enzyme A
MSDYYFLDPQNTDPKRIRSEREKAKALKKSSWWLQKLQQGLCHYCEQKFPASVLTMDHVVPLARGGRSTPGNLVPACLPCNQSKKLQTPVEQLFAQIQAQDKNSESPQNGD